MKTKLNERNAANVMGKINTFLKKNVKEDHGIHERVVGWESDEEVDGSVWERPVYATERVLTAFEGACSVHHIRKEILKKKKNGEHLLSYEKGNTCLLAIYQNGNCDCIPLSVGDTVEITSTRMVLTRNILGNYSVRTFVQAECTEEEKDNAIKSGLMNHLQWFTDATCWIDLFEGTGVDSLDVIRANNELDSILCNFISSLDLSDQGIASFDVDLDEQEDMWTYNDGVKFTFFADLDAIRANDGDFFWIEFNGEKQHDTYGVMYACFNTDETEKI